MSDEKTTPPSEDTTGGAQAGKKGGKVRQAWAKATGLQKTLVIATVAAVAAVGVAMAINGGEEPAPEPMQVWTPQGADGGEGQTGDVSAAQDEGAGETGGDKPSQDDTDTSNEADEADEIPQGDSDEDRAIRASYVLEDILNDPVPAREEFTVISKRLQEQAGVMPDWTIQKMYEYLYYAADPDVMVSRSNEPWIMQSRVKGEDRVYTLRYTAAAVIIPVKQGAEVSSADVEAAEKVVQDRADAGMGEAITFRIDFNTGVVSSDKWRWW